MSNKAPTFQDFWNIYPLHVSKKRAEGAWNRLTTKEKRLAIAAIPAYVAYIQTMPVPSYKTPQGWLNDRRWEDELAEVTDPTPAPPLQGRGVPCGQNGTFEHPRQTGSGVSQGAKTPATKTEHSGAATPLPSRGGAGVGSVTYPDGMDKW